MKVLRLKQKSISRDGVTGFQENHIAFDHFLPRNLPLGSIPKDPGFHPDAPRESLDRVSCTKFLPKTHCGAHQQNRSHHQGLRVIPQQECQRHRSQQQDNERIAELSVKQDSNFRRIGGMPLAMSTGSKPDLRFPTAQA